MKRKYVNYSIWEQGNKNAERDNTISRLQVDLDKTKENGETVAESLRSSNLQMVRIQQVFRVLELLIC